MNNYAIEVKSSARKELEGLPDGVLARVARKIESLGRVQRPAGCKKLRGHKDQWRTRVGDWRIIYIIDDTAKTVKVTRIAHRREVYE